MEFIPVSYDDISSPVEEGLYEYDEELEDYTLSEDEFADDLTTYYILIDEEEDEESTLYTLAELTGDECPADELLYEYIEEEAGYFLSEDQVVDPEKDYYIYAADQIEYDTTDNSFYFPVDLEEEAIENPAASGLYEYGDGFYFETEDTVVDYDKQYFTYEGDEEPEEIEDEEEEEVEESTIVPTEPSQSVPEVPYAEGPTGYAIAFSEFVDNPASFGYYEFDKSSGQFVLTQDVVNSGDKFYYIKVELSDYRQISIPEDMSPKELNAYELSGYDYVFTNDTTPISGKAYYVYDPRFPEYVEYDDPSVPEAGLAPDYGVPIAAEYEDD